MRILLTYGLTLIILLSGICVSNAQSLQPIPYENSGWTYVGWYIDTNTMLPEEFDVYQCYFDGDTTINTLLYNKFYFNGVHYMNLLPYSIGDHVYIGGMRNEGDLYYFLAKDSASEVLIYDLSKSNIGDTLPLGYYDHLSHIVIEDTATEMMEDGSLRKVFFLEHGWTFPYPSRLYEGIGFFTGLIPHELFSIYPCNGGYTFQSFCHQGTYVYFTGGAVIYLPDECDFTVGVDQYKESTNDISAYPNPFTISTTITYELTQPTHVQLTIFNAIGELLYKAEDRLMAVGKHTFTWSTDRLPEGLYYAVLRSDEGMSVLKIIKQ